MARRSGNPEGEPISGCADIKGSTSKMNVTNQMTNTKLTIINITSKPILDVNIVTYLDIIT